MLAAGRAFGQSGDAPAKFEIADVHVTPKDLANTYLETNPPRNGRYEFHSASMIDLIGTAYGFDAGKILGGPSWLEMDRFDVIAKVPAGTRVDLSPGSVAGRLPTLPDTMKEMLRSLLADRFKLVIRQETRPLPGYALIVGTKLQMKPADASGDTGCRYLAPTDPADTNIRYACRGMSMDAFATLWPQLRGTASNAVVDKTELNGLWNFDMKWPRSAATQGTGDEVGPADAIDKQLGLKLIPQQIPTPVMVVVSVDEKPTANLPGVAEALPTAPQPTAFDVATIKPTDPDYTGASGGIAIAPGGLRTGRAVPLSSLLVRAFSPSLFQTNSDLIVGIPEWAETARFDITGRAPAGASASARAGPMVRTLLEDRLKLKSHSDERAVSVYLLMASKPKMKKADPASRTHCIRVNPPAGSSLASLSLSCQNITMAQFADFIRIRVPGPGSPILDTTGLEGGWDFTLTYAPVRVAANVGAEPAQAASSAPPASDPNGGLTIIEAMEKQLGLKLETQKRPMTVTVIDHVERMPTDN